MCFLVELSETQKCSSNADLLARLLLRVDQGEAEVNLFCFLHDFLRRTFFGIIFLFIQPVMTLNSQFRIMTLLTKRT